LASTGIPSPTAHMIWIKSSGRGRLPVCVDGMECVARLIAGSFEVYAKHYEIPNVNPNVEASSDCRKSQ
jgi:hypothetical protein